MKIMRGHYRNNDGTLERGSLFVSPEGRRDAVCGGKLIATRYVESWGELIEVTEANCAYVFLPDVGECERCGIAIVDAAN